MDLPQKIRTMDKRLRVMLIGTALLIIPQIGQFLAIRDINTTGHESGLALVFLFAGIAAIPTAAILTAAIIATVYKQWRENERLMILGFINALIVLSLVWFFVDQCTWARVFGIALRICPA